MTYYLAMGSKCIIHQIILTETGYPGIITAIVVGMDLQSGLVNDQRAKHWHHIASHVNEAKALTLNVRKLFIRQILFLSGRLS